MARLSWIVFLLLFGFLGQIKTGSYYKTTFALTENPISEGGVWINGGTVGLDWIDVSTESGYAHGNYCPSSPPYKDPTAILKGTWSNDQEAQATVYCAKPTPSEYQEVEIRLRSSVSAHSCTGYEIFFRCLKDSNAYAEIVRWNGPLGSWTSLQHNSGGQYGVSDGDVIKATVVGNLIIGYVNGVEKVRAVDKVYSSGNPGIGFNYGVHGTYKDFGLKDFTARGLVGPESTAKEK
jgi:hypothetical protein